VWGIDNGLCFHHVEKLRTVIWDFAGEEIPKPLLADIRRICACLEARDDATAAFRDCLDRSELSALIRRCEALLSHPVLPEMYPWRCVPWPLV
jgi:hypothetical protein